MEAQGQARLRDVLGVLGRPFRRKAIVLPPCAPVAAPARRMPLPDLPEVPFVSYEPFRDYRASTAGDPSLRW